MHTPRVRSKVPVPILVGSYSYPDRVNEAKRENVTILNPVNGGGTITSRKRAIYFTRAKRAVWFGNNAIRFIDGDPRNQAAATRAAATVAPYDQSERLMLEEDLRNIPVIMPHKALGRGKRESPSLKQCAERRM
jgi:hypothetical protein